VALRALQEIIVPYQGGGMLEIHTHQKIDQTLCGQPLVLGDGFSQVSLVPSAQMVVDESGLVHGGFIFGLADYAAMICVNHPHVVLGSADVKFLKPVKMNDSLLAEAKLETSEGRKRIVHVIVKKDDITVFEGVFTCFVLDKHVLAK